MNRLIVGAGILGVCFTLALVGHSSGQQTGMETDDVATARRELIKLREKTAMEKAGNEARMAFLQDNMEQLKKETDAAVAADTSIAANRNAEALLEQRMKALKNGNTGSSDDQMRTDIALGQARMAITEREELLRTRYHGGAMGELSKEQVEISGIVHGEQAELDAISQRLEALRKK